MHIKNDYLVYITNVEYFTFILLPSVTNSQQFIIGRISLLQKYA